MKLTPESIQEAIDYVLDYKAGVETASKEVVEIIGELGVETARNKLREYGAVQTTDLLTSVNYVIEEVNGKYCVRIVADAPYFKFVEFGTGIVGKDAPDHPLHSEVGWEHDINKHGDKGWYFPGDDGKYYLTKGQPARPFLFETIEELKAAIPEIVRSVYK